MTQHEEAVDPKAPHAFKERMNLPYNIPRGGPGPGVATGPEMPFRKGDVPDDCELCSKGAAFIRGEGQAPYNIPRSAGLGEGTIVELAFRKGDVPDDCELCSKRRSDPIHAASELEANPEHWPV
jgi:hypothetical protein